MEFALKTPAARAKDLLRRALDAHGWKLQRLRTLPPVHCRDQVVTPYFSCNLSRSAIGTRDVISIDGPIGVIHQGFEQAWSQDHSCKNEESSLCTFHLIVNFPQLRDLSFIRVSNLESGVERLADAVSQTLLTMPGNEDDLRRAVQAGKLAGVSFNNFQSYGQAAKFDSFVNYVRASTTH